MARQRRGNRFHLLIYHRMWQRWARLCILIVLASLALWWFAPRISFIQPSSHYLTLVPALIAFVILVYIFLARRLAWVQCGPKHLRIKTPFYSLIVSYGRIKEVRPQEFVQVFDPAQEKAIRRRWLHPYWRKTVLVLELAKYPLSRAWLRLWFSSYLLTPDTTGFVFLVEDWMGLSRHLDDFRTTWDMRRAKRRQQRLNR